jgi:hypothetical protein
MVHLGGRFRIVCQEHGIDDTYDWTEGRKDAEHNLYLHARLMHRGLNPAEFIEVISDGSIYGSSYLHNPKAAPEYQRWVFVLNIRDGLHTDEYFTEASHGCGATDDKLSRTGELHPESAV